MLCAGRVFYPLTVLPLIFSTVDQTRVKLVDVGPEVGADYINANYINGEADGSEKAYIASQGTMPDTLAAFWQMTFENNCECVGLCSRHARLYADACSSNASR